MGLAINEYVTAAVDSDRVAPKLTGRLPADRDAAIEQLERFVESQYLRPMANLPKEEFLQAWWAVGFLHPNLHPDAACDNGKVLSKGPRRGVSFVLEPVYVRSGWPVELIPIAAEARKRYDDGGLGEDEYYCSAAVMAGAFSHKL
jgi:DNA (cytosine-5)-methyltransferase 1